MTNQASSESCRASFGQNDWCTLPIGHGGVHRHQPVNARMSSDNGGQEQVCDHLGMPLPAMVFGGDSANWCSRCGAILQANQPPLLPADHAQAGVVPALEHERDMWQMLAEIASIEHDCCHDEAAHYRREELESATRAAIRERDAQAGEAQRLRAALEPYLSHGAGCHSQYSRESGVWNAGVCDCGLDDALAPRTEPRAVQGD